MADTEELKKGESNIGGLDNRFYCRVFINGVEITPDQIMLLAIRSCIFEKTPRLELQFNDSGKMLNLFPLADFDSIKVIIANEKKDVNFIDATFKLNDHQIRQEGGNRKYYMYAMTAFLESKKFYFESKTRSFKDYSGSDVIDTIARDAGLNPDIRVKSADLMTWYQINSTDNQMIDHVLSRSYFAESDAIFSYADVRSNFIFTTLKTEIKKKPKFKAKYFSDDINPTDKSFDDADFVRIKNFMTKSFAGTFNKSMAYGASIKYYDEDLEEVSIDISDVGHELSTHSTKHKDNIETNTATKIMGIKTVNMHDNYFNAVLSNQYERFNYFPIFTEVSFEMKNQPSIVLQDETYINLFDVVDVEYVSNMSDKNKVYSGKYIIANITHQVNANGVYIMTLVLFRNGQNYGDSLIEESAISVK